jgi:hypothetical protein
MRRDRKSGILYAGYLEWLRDGHMVWLVSLLLGYWYYLKITDPAAPV